MPVRLFCSFPSSTGVDGHGKPPPHSSEMDSDSIFRGHAIGVVFIV
jgi:hypothetical protein